MSLIESLKHKNKNSRVAISEHTPFDLNKAEMLNEFCGHKDCWTFNKIPVCKNLQIKHVRWDCVCIDANRIILDKSVS